MSSICEKNKESKQKNSLKSPDSNDLIKKNFDMAKEIQQNYQKWQKPLRSPVAMRSISLYSRLHPFEIYFPIFNWMSSLRRMPNEASHMSRPSRHFHYHCGFCNGVVSQRAGGGACRCRGRLPQGESKVFGKKLRIIKIYSNQKGLNREMVCSRKEAGLDSKVFKSTNIYKIIKFYFCRDCKF